MGMTRYGLAVQLYSDNVAPRPYSMFTADAKEQNANEEWSARVQAWAANYMNVNGGLNQAGVEKYVAKKAEARP